MHRLFYPLALLLLPFWSDAAAAYQVGCSSRNYRYTECRLGSGQRVDLVRQVSSAACVYGRTWGTRSGAIWVDSGCSAIFEVSDHGGNNWGGNSGWQGGGYYPPDVGVVPGWAVGTWSAVGAGAVGVVSIFPTGAVTFGSNLGMMKGQWQNGVIRTSDGKIWQVRGRRGRLYVTSPFGNQIEFRRAG